MELQKAIDEKRASQVLDLQAISNLRDSRKFFLFFKNLVDYFFAAFWLLFFLPMFVVLALLVKLSGPGPVFFRQRRVGRDYKIFTIYKFRTMVCDAEERFPDGLAPLERPNPDCRITHLGVFLRRWRLDEFPQMWNVLKGEMSFVGPRPLTLNDTSYCPKPYMMRFAVKPGMFGLWQGLRPNTAPHRVKFFCDSKYTSIMSLRLDVYLFFRCLMRGFSPE